MKEFTMQLGDLTDDEREIILKGCLINYNRKIVSLLRDLLSPGYPWTGYRGIFAFFHSVTTK